jgi:hypothetical protein
MLPEAHSVALGTQQISETLSRELTLALPASSSTEKSQTLSGIFPSLRRIRQTVSGKYWNPAIRATVPPISREETLAVQMQPDRFNWLLSVHRNADVTVALFRRSSEDVVHGDVPLTRSVQQPPRPGLNPWHGTVLGVTLGATFCPCFRNHPAFIGLFV